MAKLNLKMCIGYSNTPLKKLNESAGEGSLGKYMFSGVFTACSVPGHVVINRNNRSYGETEMCRHLPYLRESIKTNGCLLGELDHPEGRFDIQLKEASHKITDLWYDQANHNVMGKLELLDTPNGQIAKNLIDAGYPLFVSSRAAGDVDEKTHEVSIQQIFTYDIVCTPGFAEARLDRVNESLLTDEAKNFINESVILRKNKTNSLKKLSVITENVDVYEIDETIEINEKVNKIMSNPVIMENICTPLLEEDETKGFQLPTADTNPSTASNDSSDADEAKEEKKDVKDESPKNKKKIDAKKDSVHEDEDEKEEKRGLILGIVGEDKNGDPVKGDIDTTEDSDKEENKDKILDIQAESDDDTDDESADTNEELGDSDDVKEAKAKKDKLTAETEKEIAELDAVLDSVTKAESVKESIVQRYPFAISLSDENFAKFAALRPKQKKKCADFIVEHEIFNIHAINELWSTPLKEEKRVQQNWLKLASLTDIDLYVNAPVEIQDAIEESAKYVILETQEDVNEFWRRTGLRQAEAQRRMNEEFVSYYRTNVSAQTAPTQQTNDNPLGYNMDFIRMTEDYFNNN